MNPPYQIARVLGHGGFGITYLGWDANLQIKVAIKEFLPRDFARRNSQNGQISALPGEAEQHFVTGLQQFLDEARILAKFQQHPGIVSVLAFFRAFGTGYMVMEYIEGETLKSYLQRRGGRLNWQQTLDIFMQIMDALRAVHGAGLLHRDIAPDNIYLCSDGRIKLLDFGAARHALAGDSHSLVIVKPGFAPEEQYQGTFEQGPWSDVYSVAASMYFCLTGQTPPEALDRAARDTLQPPSAFGVTMPVAAENTLLNALAVKAWQRPQSIEALQRQLLTSDSLQSSQTLSTPARRTRQPSTLSDSPEPIDTPIPTQRWWLIGLIAAALFIVVYQLARIGLEHKPAAIIRQKPTPAVSSDDSSNSSSLPGDEDIDWAAQRERERAAAEELKQQQAAALRRFEAYRKNDMSEKEESADSDELRQEHLRSLCNEWGATMDCQNIK